MSRAQAVRARYSALAALFHPATLAVLLLLLAARAFAGDVTLQWNPVSSTSLAGYMLYYGSSAGNYTSKVDVGNATSRDVANLVDGATYHFAVTAYDASHTESAFSNDVTATVASGAPVANFTSSATSGVAPLAMNFTSTSTGSITGYAWTFGDGGTSTAQNPSHVYSTAGSYQVALTVTGSGGSNTKTAPNYVTVSTLTPTPTPTPDTTPPSAPSNLAATASGSSTINLTWNASTDNVGVSGYLVERCQGAGCTSFAQIATSSTTAFGDTGLGTFATYTYRVRSTDAAGNVSGYSNTAIATTLASTASAPVAAMTATPTSGKAPLAVNFTSTSTGTITSYAWSFGDGSTSAVQNPSHTYTSNGRYTVKLTISGPGGTSSRTYTNFVSVRNRNH